MLSSSATTPPTSFVDELFGRAEGSPLFTEEIINALEVSPSADGRVSWPPHADALPPALSDVLRTRLSALRPQTQHVLAAAAIIGRCFDDRLLVAISGQTLASVRAALREAIDRQLIVDRGTAEPYEFRHALIQEAAAGLSLTTERRELHLRAARALEERDSPATTQHASLASHYRLAGDAVNALPHVVAAGDHARNVGIAAEAARWYREAVDIYEELSQPCPITLLEKAAEASTGAKHLRMMPDAFGRLIAAYRASGDQLAEGDAISRFAYAASELDPVLRASRLDEAIALLEPLGPSAALARAYAGRSQVRFSSLYQGGGELYRSAKQARDMARLTGARDAEAIALRTMGSLLANGGKLDRGYPLLRDSIDIARETDSYHNVQWGLINLVNVHMKYGNWEAAEDVAREGIRYANEQALGAFLGHIMGRLVDVLRLSGRWYEARAVADEALMRTEDADGALSSVQFVACRLAADERRWSDVMHLSTQILGVAESHTFMLHGVALFLRAKAVLALGQQDEALTMIEPVIALWNETNDLYYGPPIAVFACQLYCARGDFERAGVLQRRLADMTPRMPPLDAATAEAAATIASAKGQQDAAVDGWRSALEIWHSLRRPLDAGVAEFQLAQALLRRGSDGDRADAREHLSSARERFASCGAPNTHDVDELLRRSRLVAPASRRVGKQLSDRERQIAVLIAGGSSNGQIAETLFLSPRTVENHVGRIFTKLSLTSRAQLASYATEHRLVESHAPPAN